MERVTDETDAAPILCGSGDPDRIGPDRKPDGMRDRGIPACTPNDH